MYELPLGDQRAASVVAPPVIRDGLDECLVVVVIGGEDFYEVGNGGLCVWVVGDGWRRVFCLKFVYFKVRLCGGVVVVGG